MIPDRSWISRRKDPIGRINTEFQDGVDDFIKFVQDHPDVFYAANRILCPCARCKLHSRMEAFWVEKYLYSYGFMPNYINWTAYGEEVWSASNPIINEDVREARNPYVDMVMDACGGHEMEGDNLEEEPNPSAKEFYNLLRDADEPLWNGCKKRSIFSAVTQLLNLKSEYHWSESCYDRMLIIIKSMLPDLERLPDNFYKTKKMVNGLGLGYEKIDVDQNFCVLYYKEYQSHTMCPICDEPRYKPKNETNEKQRDVSYKSIRYFLIAPRLKRLYMSKHTAKYMRWHATGFRQDPSVITHPSDAEAWKSFNVTHTEFAEEIRNVRLGLCTDGFNPFTNSTYSCWSVFVTPYNLPPSMCMKKEYIFLTVLIPKPRSPCQSLDVCLRPLIDDLNMLWKEGELTFDAWKKQNFMMKVALLWTISDFPAYGMLSVLIVVKTQARLS